jgi:hypothetical protein
VKNKIMRVLLLLLIPLTVDATAACASRGHHDGGPAVTTPATPETTATGLPVPPRTNQNPCEAYRDSPRSGRNNVAYLELSYNRGDTRWTANNYVLQANGHHRAEVTSTISLVGNGDASRPDQNTAYWFFAPGSKRLGVVFAYTQNGNKAFVRYASVFDDNVVLPPGAQLLAGTNPPAVMVCGIPPQQ